MSTTRFRVHGHTIAASHIREYPRATADSQEDELCLAIKQYVPFVDCNTDEIPITVIGAHANGFPKELYEPFWDVLFDRLKAKKIHISSIWIADCSHQGESGVLNEAKLGNDPSWMDYSRDMFLMVNTFRKHMKRPLVGIGHSMGAAALVNLSLMHPRLLTTLVLMDPVIQKRPDVGGNFKPAQASTIRRDRWPSRHAAEAAFARSKFYSTWDPRVLEKWLQHGLRDLPTYIYPDISTSSTLPILSSDPATTLIPPSPSHEREVTLKTTKHQEVLTFLRPNFPTPAYPSPSTHPNPSTHPDINLSIPPTTPFYRSEPLFLFPQLPHLRPSVLYIFADQSPLSSRVHVSDKLLSTGTGVGGSGGVARDRVRAHTFHGVGHLIPMEIVGEAANAASGWVVGEMERWKIIEDEERGEWSRVPRRERGQMSGEFVGRMRGDWFGEKAKL